MVRNSINFLNRILPTLGAWRVLRPTLAWRFFKSAADALLLTALIVGVSTVGLAQVRTSSNYQLQSDSINVGGGLSSSTNYVQESTVGEIATGPSDSATYSLKAGYQQMQEVYVSIAVSGDVTMSPALGGLSGGTSNGSTTVTVITDSPSGYRLTIEAENDPAMLRDGGGDSIADYNEGADPDFTFSTAAGEAHLGYTPEGVDITQPFLDDTGSCNSGATDTSLACWAGLATTTTAIAEGAGSNHPSGATTTVHFRVGLGSSANILSGDYTATTTVTALPL